MHGLIKINRLSRVSCPGISIVLLMSLLYAGTTVAGRSIKAVELSQLDAVEASHLTFMREEEKLARDVYLSFAERYPDQPVFSQIATKSEQTHTDTLRDKLADFGLPDPNPTANDLPASQGVFAGEEWGGASRKNTPSSPPEDPKTSWLLSMSVPLSKSWTCRILRSARSL